MARVGLQLVPKISLPGVRRLVAKLGDCSEPLRESVKVARDFVRQEFQGGFWLMPSGGRRAWARTKPFGDIPAHQTGVRSGRLLRAWLGGLGGLAKVTPRTMTVGVDAGAIPYAGPFRGGTGATPRLSDMVIRPKRRARDGRWAMFWAVALGKARVWLREATLRAGIRVPTHPHGTKHPALVKAVKQRLVDHLKKAA